jgi:hypothetical protein
MKNAFIRLWAMACCSVSVFVCLPFDTLAQSVQVGAATHSTSSTSASVAPIVLSKALHGTAPFLSHSGTGAFDNYLAMNLPFEPIRTLHKAVEQRLGRTLINRGEAHITIIKPTEYSAVLGKVLTMHEIDSIALALHIQQAAWSVVCLGRAQYPINGTLEQTYYVVVRSEDMLAIRKAIFVRFVERGGEPSLFDPSHVYLHITVGFTKQDLHEEVQGVRKSENSCLWAIEER